MQNTGGRLWGVFGWIALLFYLAGVAEYLMMRLQFAPYLRMMAPDQQAWLLDMPTLIGAAWALSVWAGFLGGVLMVMRIEGGVAALALAALSTVALTLYAIFWMTPSLAELGGAEAAWLLAAVAGLSVALWLIPRTLKRQGW
jgi:hypothetical protein